MIRIVNIALLAKFKKSDEELVLPEGYFGRWRCSACAVQDWQKII